jgi:methionyl-tRNA formyltransferase
MLAQQSIAIEADDDAGTLHDKLAALGAQMIVRTLDALARGQLAAATPQPDAGVSYANKLDKPDRYLDWTRPAQALACLVRALRPAPGARTLFAGEPLTIWEAQVVDGHGEPGRVIGLGEGGIIVACGQDALAIRRLQRAGGKPLDAGAFQRGRSIDIGDALGMPTQ